MPKITAFVARSFFREDNLKIQPVMDFLESFRPLGFVCETAEPAEVESVSKKVRDMIDASDVFIGIFTKRRPILPVPAGLKAVIDVLKGQFIATEWSAPPWVLQESGYALRAGKQLILFREPGVEIPGLQGDLEYIPFEPSHPSSAFQKLSEMVNRLIASTAGIAVETVVVAVAESKEAPIAPSPPQAEQPPPQPESAPGYFEEMLQHISQRNWQAAEGAYQEFVTLARENEPDKVVLYQTIYHRERVKMGHPGALDDLRSLAAGNPGDPTPTAVLGRCLFEFEQYIEAAKCYKSASAVADADDAIRYQIRAADCLRLAREFDESGELLIKAWVLSRGTEAALKFEVLRCLCGVLKDSRESFMAFAIAEMALHENPTRSDFRFSVGLDYDASGYLELFLQHYKLICERDQENASALHNLGLAYSKLGLPINSVLHYKRAFNLGETLSASNLGYVYLEAGMVDEAVSLLQEAQKKEGCVPDVTRCLAAVDERQKQERDKLLPAKLSTSKKQQDFLVSLGEAFLSEDVPPLSGKWTFPFGKIILEFRSGKLRGEAVIEVRGIPISSLAGLGGILPGLGTLGTAAQKFEKITFSGEVRGRTCKYQMEKETVQKPELGSAGTGDPLRAAAASLLGGGVSVSNGYMVFTGDGRSASVAEFKEGKPSKYYQIEKHDCAS
jgi:pentatricopeptide repeat protein